MCPKFTKIFNDIRSFILWKTVLLVRQWWSSGRGTGQTASTRHSGPPCKFFHVCKRVHLVLLGVDLPSSNPEERPRAECRARSRGQTRPAWSAWLLREVGFEVLRGWHPCWTHSHCFALDVRNSDQPQAFFSDVWILLFAFASRVTHPSCKMDSTRDLLLLFVMRRYRQKM